MKSFTLGVVVSTLLFGGAGLAQTTQRTAPAGAGSMTAPAQTPNGTAPAAAGPDEAAARGDSNQAVATTGANAPAPAKGANSFTMGEAKSRLEKNGFSNVSDLAKDDNGVWRGNAQKGGGSKTTVWLDYKGNIGEGK